MKELMVHVERIVRPIRADASKLRIRNELLAHLQAAYDQGRAEGLNEPAALAEAKRRLGDPATLTRELQASIPKYERLAVTPFPAYVGRAIVILAAVTPVIVAMAYISFRTMSQGNRILFIAGIVVLELTCWLWYSFTVPLYRRPIRWGEWPPRALRLASPNLHGRRW